MKKGRKFRVPPRSVVLCALTGLALLATMPLLGCDYDWIEERSNVSGVSNVLECKHSTIAWTSKDEKGHDGKCKTCTTTFTGEHKDVNKDGTCDICKYTMTTNSGNAQNQSAAEDNKENNTNPAPASTPSRTPSSITTSGNTAPSYVPTGSSGTSGNNTPTPQTSTGNNQGGNNQGGNQGGSSQGGNNQGEDQGGSGTITHNWSDTYSYDEESHWFGCTDSGCTARREEGEHDWEYVNVSETQHKQQCKICKFEKPESLAAHDYTTGYGHNQECHWPQCICGSGLTNESDGHHSDTYTFDNTNHWIVCDVCGEVCYKKAHSYDENAWEYVDDEQHGNPCVQECGKIGNLAAHVPGDDGKCTLCTEPEAAKE